LATGVAVFGLGAVFCFAGGSIEIGCRFSAGGLSTGASAGCASAAGLVSLTGTPSVSSKEFQRSDFPGSDINEKEK
jgi:hypothetical protein